MERVGRKEGISRSMTTKKSLNKALHRLPIQVRHFSASGLVDKHAAGLCCDRPGDGLRGMLFARREGGLRRDGVSCNPAVTSGKLDGGYG